MKRKTRVSGQAILSGLGQICILVLLVAAGLALSVPVRMNWRLKCEMENAQEHLFELERLYPLYAELVSMQKPSQWAALKMTNPVQLSEQDVLGIPFVFQELADRSEMELNLVSPRVQTDDAGRRYLSVDLRATGPYRQLQPFLGGVAQLPMLERLERLEIRREALQEQVSVLVHLALE